MISRFESDCKHPVTAACPFAWRITGSRTDTLRVCTVCKHFIYVRVPTFSFERKLLGNKCVLPYLYWHCVCVFFLNVCIGRLVAYLLSPGQQLFNFFYKKLIFHTLLILSYYNILRHNYILNA